MKNDLFWFCLTFGLMLITALMMNIQALQFYTKNEVVSRFSILNVQLAGSAHELLKIVKGIYKLPPEQSQKTEKALRMWFYVNFLFMPFAYCSVFILCIVVNRKMYLPSSHYVFKSLALLQAVSWLLNIIESIYLLKKIGKHFNAANETAHKRYLIMVAVKWLILLTAVVFSVSAICYFWLSGYYSKSSLHYLMIVLAEVIVYFLIQSVFIRSKNNNILKAKMS